MGVVFLVGAWAAILSSLLGVWQAVPLIFADAVTSLKRQTVSLQDLPNTQAYKIGLWVLALVPMLSLVMSFKEIQKLYSLVGAFFMPILALTLLWLNNKYVSQEFKNGAWINGALALVFLFFVATSFYKFMG